MKIKTSLLAYVCEEQISEKHNFLFPVLQTNVINSN